MSEKSESENKEQRAGSNKGGLSIASLRDSVQVGAAQVKPGMRLFLNAKRDKLVPDGHADAAFLYCSDTESVPADEFFELAENSSPEVSEPGHDDELPTMDNTKDEILAYLEANDIDHDASLNKSDLLELLED